MADKDGRGGGLGWFIVGLLIGVAGTLAMQRFVQSGGPARPTAVASEAAPASEAPLPVVVKIAPLSSHPPSAAPTPAAPAALCRRR